MTKGFVNGVNLLPATGEFSYGAAARQGQRVSESLLLPVNFYFGNIAPPTATVAGAPPVKTDDQIAIDQLQSALPACTTVAIVVAWFGSSTDASTCKIYPSTTYLNNGTIINPGTGLAYATLPKSFIMWNGSAWITENWKCSSLTETSTGIIHISQDAFGNFTYGGTPSDQSIVECIADLKSRGFRVVFYPFILMDSPGKPWRGRITTSPDVSSAATSAVSSFFGSAAPANFTRDFTNKTVSYSGSSTDFTYRRMILHYANLCIVAGGVDLFLIGSEFRGLETIRGPAWTLAGTTDGSGKAIWDYPFVQGMITLSDGVRSIFDAAGFAKDVSALHNLISYAADWSDWMGWQHPGANPAMGTTGQWPHLDQLWAHANIDLVCFDNYLPLSDWTTGSGGLDVLNWSAPAATDSFLDYRRASETVLFALDQGLASDPQATIQVDYGLASAPPAWPPGPSTMSGLGLTGTPTLPSKAYLKANIEGGEKFNWFYFDSTNLGFGLDPNGSDLRVSRPEGDRVTQTRNQFFPNQQILGNKQIRWWWNNSHRALYDLGLGAGEVPQGPNTQWIAQSKSIVFTEYGFPSCDRATNQPNVFFDPRSTESFTPYWSIWDSVDGGGFAPRRDQNISLLALQAIYEYWFTDGFNATSSAGLKMIEPAFCSIWNWDARPFPAFPSLVGVWGDAGNWQAGNWLGGKGPFLTPTVADAPFVPGPYPAFPTLSTQGWSIHYRPEFATGVHEHVSGRGSRFSRMSAAVWEIEIHFDLLTMDIRQDLQTLAGFYESVKGQDLPFAFPADPALGIGSPVNCRFEDDSEDLDEFMNRLWQVRAVKLRTVKE